MNVLFKLTKPIRTNGVKINIPININKYAAPNGLLIKPLLNIPLSTHNKSDRDKIALKYVINKNNNGYTLKRNIFSFLGRIISLFKKLFIALVILS